MRLLGLVVALILVAAHSVSLGQERRCDGDCSDKAPLPPGEGAPTPSPPPAAAAAEPADGKQRRPPPPPDEAKPPPVESDVALHFTNHVHVTLNDTWDPPGHVHRDVVVENGSSLTYAASFLSHSVTGDDGEELEPATPASVLNNTIALGEDSSKVKVLLDSSNNLKEPDLIHDEDAARAAVVQTPSTGKLEANATAALPEEQGQQFSKNDTNRDSISKEDHPPEIVVTQEPTKKLGTTKADLLLDIVTQGPLKNSSNNGTSIQEHQEVEKALVSVNRNKTETSTKLPSSRNGNDTQERRSSTRLVIKKVTKTEPEDDEASSTPLPRENKIFHGSSRRRTQEVTTLRSRRRSTTTQQPETTAATTLRSFRRKSYTDATVIAETTTTAATAVSRRRPSEEDSEETMVRVELSTMPSRRPSFRPISSTTTRTTTSGTITSSSSVSTSRGRVKFFDSSSSRTTTTTPTSSNGSISLVPMRRLLLPPTPSPGTNVQEPRPFSLGMQENKHVAVHVPAPPTTTDMTTTEDSATSSSTTVVEETWTTEDDEDAFVSTTTENKVNGSREADDDDAVSTTMTWPMPTTTTTKSPDRSSPNESESTVMTVTESLTTDRPEEASTVTVAPTERVETQTDGGEDGEDTSTTLTTTVTSQYETSCYATLWASGEELCRRLGDVRDAFLAALKTNSQQDGDDDREVPPPSGPEVSLRLIQPWACERLKVARRRVEVTVQGLPDGCMRLLDLWHAENLASPFQVSKFHVPGEFAGSDGYTDELEDDNTTVSTVAVTTTMTTTTTTSAVDDEVKTTVAATTTEEVPPPAESGGGGGEDGNNAGVVAAIVVSSVGGVCLVLLAVLLVVLRRRQRRFRSYGQRCTPVSLDAYSLDSVSVGDAASVRSRRKGVLRASKRSYGNAAFTLDERDPASPSHPLTFAGLAAFCADNSAAIEAEFALVPQVSVTTDELPPGADVKNRYANVTPLPETCVQLSRRGDDPLSTYINANYVKGPEGEPRFYIATQAPTASTVTDFWRMVWEQQSRTILMATLLVENGVERCCDYLPPSEVLDCHRVFGDFQITLKKRDQKDHYVVSTLQIKNLETNLWREVTHLWLVSWPCEGVPEDPRSVVAFLVEARPFTKAAGPVVVHCSPGTGRTGTIIACDILLRHFEKTRTVDVPRCVAAIRRERAGAVKTSQQYVFIYKLLNLYAAMLTGGALDSL